MGSFSPSSSQRFVPGPAPPRPGLGPGLKAVLRRLRAAGLGIRTEVAAADTVLPKARSRPPPGPRSWGPRWGPSRERAAGRTRIPRAPPGSTAGSRSQCLWSTDRIRPRGRCRRGAHSVRSAAGPRSAGRARSAAGARGGSRGSAGDALAGGAWEAAVPGTAARPRCRARRRCLLALQRTAVRGPSGRGPEHEQSPAPAAGACAAGGTSTLRTSSCWMCPCTRADRRE